MKKNIGDPFTMVSLFGYEFSGTVTGVIFESAEGNIYEVEFDEGPSRKVEEGEWHPIDNNTYLPKPKLGAIQEVEIAGAFIIPAAGKYN